MYNIRLSMCVKYSHCDLEDSCYDKADVALEISTFGSQTPEEKPALVLDCGWHFHDDYVANLEDKVTLMILQAHRNLNEFIIQISTTLLLL